MANPLRFVLDPLPAFNFLVVLLNTYGLPVSAAGFSECSGLETTLEIEEYQEGGQNDRVHKFPTRFTYTNLVLKRGVLLASELRLWHLELMRGNPQRRDGMIIMLNELRIPLLAWKFEAGLPVKYIGPALVASSSEAAIETLEISYEKLELFDIASIISGLP